MPKPQTIKGIMKRKPIKILTDKVGKKQLATMIGVDLSTVYLWLYRESGERQGRRPSFDNALALVQIARRENVKSLTLGYLQRL